MTKEIPPTGAIVEDVEAKSQDAIVINTPSKTAAEWTVDDDRTVADDNPEYPADDPIVVVLHRSQVEEHIPLYSGGVLPLSKVCEVGIKLYAFPLSRLDVVGELETPTVSIDAIHPSPYHSRTFDASTNREFIESINNTGELPGPVRARVLQHRPLKLELLNGHKRAWAACVAGFDEVPVWAQYWFTDEEAARIWARQHLPTYTSGQQHRAIERLQNRFGQSVAMDILEDTTGTEEFPT
jgi:ParB family chromosome partitioning protein